MSITADGVYENIVSEVILYAFKYLTYLSFKQIYFGISLCYFKVYVGALYINVSS